MLAITCWSSIANFASIVDSNDIFALGFNLAIGIEKRKPLDDNLSFTHGFDPAVRFSLSSSGNGQAVFNPSLGYVLDFQFNVSDSSRLILETIPSIGASFIVDDDGLRDSANFNFGFNTNSEALSLV